jgi:integrase
MPKHSINKLTDRKIKSLVSAGRKTAVSDGDGLTLTISSTGFAAWVLRYRIGGKPKEVTIGSLSDYPLAKAREQRTQLRQAIADGGNPAMQKLATKAIDALADESPESFEQLAWLWFEKTQAKRLKHPEVIERVIRNYLNPKLGKLHISDIKPAHITLTIESIINAGAPSVANDARRHLREIFSYAVMRGDLEISPAAQVNAKIAGHKETARDRALSLSEISKLCQAMAKERDWFGRDNEISVLLLLMLGIRKSELIKARWAEFDLDDALWTIPKARIKRGTKDFTIALPAQAVELLRELEVRSCGSDWVLPARKRGSRNAGHVSADTLNRALAELKLSIDAFTVHDLRRTMRTQLSAIGVPFATAERCLNHKLPGQGEIYDQHDFIEQRQAALQSWADLIDVLLSKGITAAKAHIGGAKIHKLRPRQGRA